MGAIFVFWRAQAITENSEMSEQNNPRHRHGFDTCQPKGVGNVQRVDLNGLKDLTSRNGNTTIKYMFSLISGVDGDTLLLNIISQYLHLV